MNPPCYAQSGSSPPDLTSPTVVPARGKRRLKQFAHAVLKEPPRESPAPARMVSEELQARINEDVRAGRVYTLREVQDKLRVSYEKARQICRTEPGILRPGDVRIPGCVLDNITQRLTQFRAAA
jgi:ribosomal protein S25